MAITLHNPHSILATLETRPQDISRIVLPCRSGGGASVDAAWSRVARLAEEKKVPLHYSNEQKAASASNRPGSRPGSGHKSPAIQLGGRTSVAEATLREKEPVAIEELFAGAQQRSGGHGLWLALDCLQDPHNVGAIFRTAAFFGVHGIVLTQERSAPLSATAYDVSSGGIEYVPHCMQVNLQRAFEVAKDAGMWVLGTSEHAHDDFRSVAQDRPWLLVLGNEEKGMRRLTEESCDVLCTIPCLGKVTSLNVSVASGILISHFGGKI